jgi:hypothetical protein
MTINQASKLAIMATAGAMSVAGLVTTVAGQTVPVPVRVVALSGQQVPGGPPGMFIANSSLMTQQLSINNNGRVAFVADVDAPNEAERQAVLSDVEGSIRVVGLSNETQPGFPFATVFSGFNRVLLTDGDNLSATGSTRDLAGSQTTYLFKRPNEPWQIVARSGSLVPSPEVGVSWFLSVGNFDSFRTNASGSGVVLSGLTGTGVTNANNTALYRTNGASASMLLRLGMPTPPSIAPAGNFFVGLNPFDGNIAVNNAGDALFLTQVGPQLSGSLRHLIVSSGNSLRTAVRSGASALPQFNGTFSSFSAWRINAAGRVAFSAEMDGTAPNPDRSGLWVETQSGLRLVASTGTQAPDLAAGVLLSNSFILDCGVHNNQTLVKFMSLAGSGVSVGSDTGLYLFDGSNLRLVIREGVQQAPGLPANVALSNLFGVGTAPAARIQLNELDQFVFRSNITGAGVDSTNDEVLWLGRADRSLRPIVRSGQTVDVDPRPEVTTLKTIRSIGTFPASVGPAGGEPRVLNDNQELVFGVLFTDNTRAVLVANLACVSISQQPQGTQVCPGASVPLVVASSTAGPLTYQWQRQVAGGPWTNLANGLQSDGSTVAGATATQLLLSNVVGGTASYRAVVTASCGSVNTAPATVRVTQQCGLADVAGEGGAILPCGDTFLDNNDFVVFIGWFFDLNVRADIAGQGASVGSDGSFDNNDFVLFIQRFFDGC